MMSRRRRQTTEVAWEGCSQKEHSVRGGLFEVTGFAKAVEAVIRADHQLFFYQCWR